MTRTIKVLPLALLSCLILPQIAAAQQCTRNVKGFNLGMHEPALRAQLASQGIQLKNEILRGTGYYYSYDDIQIQPSQSKDYVNGRPTTNTNNRTTNSGTPENLPVTKPLAPQRKIKVYAHPRERTQNNSSPYIVEKISWNYSETPWVPKSKTDIKPDLFEIWGKTTIGREISQKWQEHCPDIDYKKNHGKSHNNIYGTSSATGATCRIDQYNKMRIILKDSTCHYGFNATFNSFDEIIEKMR